MLTPGTSVKFAGETLIVRRPVGGTDYVLEGPAGNTIVASTKDPRFVLLGIAPEPEEVIEEEDDYEDEDDD